MEAHAAALQLPVILLIAHNTGHPNDAFEQTTIRWLAAAACHGAALRAAPTAAITTGAVLPANATTVVAVAAVVNITVVVMGVKEG